MFTFFNVLLESLKLHYVTCLIFHQTVLCSGLSQFWGKVQKVYNVSFACKFKLWALHLQWTYRAAISNHLTWQWIFEELFCFFFFFWSGDFRKLGPKGICGSSTILKESFLTSLGGARRKPKWRNGFAQIRFLSQSCKAQKTAVYSGYCHSFFNSGLGMKPLPYSNESTAYPFSNHFWPLPGFLLSLSLPLMWFCDYCVWDPARHSAVRWRKTHLAMAKLEWALVTDFSL